MSNYLKIWFAVVILILVGSVIIISSDGNMAGCHTSE